jgi:hypothetical protein
MRGLNVLLCTSALLAGLAIQPAPAAAQVTINVGIQPVCSYGYYDYAPYACSPMGYYGPGYFYNGIFLGMGPWAGWGYGHGWGGHRFVEAGGGTYRGGGGEAANRGNYARPQAVRAGAPRTNAGRVAAQRTSAPRAKNSPAKTRQAAPARNNGEARPAGGGHPAGGGRPGGEEHK